MGKLKYIIGVFFIFISCEDADNINSSIDENVIINQSVYEDTNTDNYSIINVTVIENILTIKIGSSGCSSENWNATLIDSSVIIEPQPPQRSLKLKLENNEACLAYFTKEYSFNISGLQTEGNQVLLFLNDWDTPILYNY